LEKLVIRSLRASAGLAVTVGLVDLVGVVLAAEVVVLVRRHTGGEHGTGENTWGVLGEVGLLVIGVVIGVDEAEKDQHRAREQSCILTHSPQYRHMP
jgi:hypothetical protein